MVDEEWIKLIAEAKQLGLTIEEVRNFLIKNGILKRRKLQGNHHDR